MRIKQQLTTITCDHQNPLSCELCDRSESLDQTILDIAGTFLEENCCRVAIRFIRADPPVRFYHFSLHTLADMTKRSARPRSSATNGQKEKVRGYKINFNKTEFVSKIDIENLPYQELIQFQGSYYQLRAVCLPALFEYRGREFESNYCSFLPNRFQSGDFCSNLSSDNTKDTLGDLKYSVKRQ